jgi:hypothetical protein
VSTTLDSVSLDFLRRTSGMRLEKVVARRYPGYTAYSQVIATFSDDHSIRVDLIDEVVAPKFEVFVARVRRGELPNKSAEWDQFEFGDFVVASVFVLRREEWIEKPSKTNSQLIGKHSAEQKFGALGDADDSQQVVVVDSGICFVSTCGAELNLDADTFPLVLQLRYEVAPSPLPQTTRVGINQYLKQ